MKDGCRKASVFLYYAENSVIERVREQCGELIADVPVPCFGAQYLHLGRKLRQKLPARAARSTPILAVGIDRYADKALVPLADGLDAGRAFGADGAA